MMVARHCVLVLVVVNAAAAFQVFSTTCYRQLRLYSAVSEPETITRVDSHASTDEQQRKQGSKALESILGNTMTLDDFFKNVWQEKPLLFSNTVPYEQKGDGIWNEDEMREAPLQELTRQGWHVLTDLLERGPTQRDAPELALVMKNREVQNRQECFDKYGATLFGPYLDGCSIVQNHADLISPWIAAFCQDLQQSFPHVYANTYLTPPDSQAMNPHADDREVFVVQLCGSKQWRVFEQVPIEYPYPHEQVGKNGLPVPPQVLEGNLAISAILKPGDVLYIPRGHVHQARCTDSFSFHVTIAIATFDWTLAGMMNVATNSILTKIKDYRKGILPSDSEEQLQSQIDDALDRLKKQITAEAIRCNLQARIEKHVHRAASIRMKQIERARSDSWKESESEISDMVGLHAANEVTLTTTVRGATPEEQAQIQSNQRLIVREEISNDLLSVITKLQSDTTLGCPVSDLRSLLQSSENPNICDLALLGLAKRAVELGQLVIVR